MPRPSTPPGTFGTVWVSETGPPYKARVRFKDRDGVMRTVAKFGKTAAAAERTLKETLAERQLASGALTSATVVRDLADRWLANVATSDLASQTKQHYTYAVSRYVKPNLGALRVTEADSGLCDEALKRIRATNGPAAARTTRAVLNGMFGLAVRYRALTVNPVRETEPISGKKKLARSLPWGQVADLLAKLRADEPGRPLSRAREWDLIDLADWMLFTGCRIGEALAVRVDVNREGEPILDLETGTWEVNATMIRVHGVGNVIQERPKSEASWRRIAIPSAAVELARARLDDMRLRPRSVKVMGEDGKIREVPGLPIVFPAPKGFAVRDPSNTQSDLREVLDSLDCDECNRTGYQIGPDGEFLLNGNGRRIRCRLGPWSWLSSHTFRKTVATRLKDLGWTPEEVADFLGHSESSMTQNVYFGRRVANPRSALDLDR